MYTNDQNSSSKNVCSTITLHNGVTIPLIGLGTYKIEDPEISVMEAIKNGYRAFDTAKLYDNEEAIGKVVKKCLSENILKREELFISTKLWNNDHEDLVGSLKDSIKRFNLDYIDLFLIHWPIGEVKDNKIVKQLPLYKTWKKWRNVSIWDLLRL